MGIGPLDGFVALLSEGSCIVVEIDCLVDIPPGCQRGLVQVVGDPRGSWRSGTRIESCLTCILRYYWRRRVVSHFLRVKGGIAGYGGV
jgi:hypothetical protein